MERLRFFFAVTAGCPAVFAHILLLPFVCRAPFVKKKRPGGILSVKSFLCNFYNSTSRNTFSSTRSWTIFVLGDMPTGYLPSCCKCPFREFKGLKNIKQHHRSPNKNNGCCAIWHYFVAKLQMRSPGTKADTISFYHGFYF